MAILIGILISFASGPFAMGAEGPVHCKGKVGDDKLVLTMSKFHLTLQRGAEPPEKFTLTTRQVKGVGEFARTIFRYGKKYVSYRDRYGCVDDFELPEKLWGFRVEDLKCTRQGTDCTKAKTQAK